jgi:hypothetical protein
MREVSSSDVLLNVACIRSIVKSYFYTGYYVNKMLFLS